MQPPAQRDARVTMLLLVGDCSDGLLVWYLDMASLTLATFDYDSASSACRLERTEC